MAVPVGLKYCGGCAPRFDRVAFVERLRDLVSDHVRFVPYDDPGVDHVVIITGCQSACVDQAPFDGKRIYLVSDEEDLLPLSETLKQLK